MNLASIRKGQNALPALKMPNAQEKGKLEHR